MKRHSDNSESVVSRSTKHTRLSQGSVKTKVATIKATETGWSSTINSIIHDPGAVLPPLASSPIQIRLIFDKYEMARLNGLDKKKAWNLLLQEFAYSPDLWIIRGGDLLHDFRKYINTTISLPLGLTPAKKSLRDYLHEKVKRLHEQKDLVTFFDSSNETEIRLRFESLRQNDCQAPEFFPIENENEGLKKLTLQLIDEGVGFFYFDSFFDNPFAKGFGKGLTMITNVATHIDGGTKYLASTMSTYNIQTIYDAGEFTVPHFTRDLKIVLNRERDVNQITFVEGANQFSITSKKPFSIENLAKSIGVNPSDSPLHITIEPNHISWSSHTIPFAKTVGDWAQMIYVLLLNYIGIRTVFLTNDHLCLALAAALGLPHVILMRNKDETHVEYYKFDQRSISVSDAKIETIRKILSRGLDPAIIEGLDDRLTIVQAQFTVCCNKLKIPSPLRDFGYEFIDSIKSELSRLATFFVGDPARFAIDELRQFFPLTFLDPQAFFKRIIKQRIIEFNSLFRPLANLTRTDTIKADENTILNLTDRLIRIFNKFTSSKEIVNYKVAKTLNLLDFSTSGIPVPAAAATRRQKDWRTLIYYTIKDNFKDIAKDYYHSDSTVTTINPRLVKELMTEAKESKEGKEAKEEGRRATRSKDSVGGAILELRCVEFYDCISVVTWTIVHNFLNVPNYKPNKGNECVYDESLNLRSSGSSASTRLSPVSDDASSVNAVVVPVTPVAPVAPLASLLSLPQITLGARTEPGALSLFTSDKLKKMLSKVEEADEKAEKALYNAEMARESLHRAEQIKLKAIERLGSLTRAGAGGAAAGAEIERLEKEISTATSAILRASKEAGLRAAEAEEARNERARLIGQVQKSEAPLVQRETKLPTVPERDSNTSSSNDNVDSLIQTIAKLNVKESEESKDPFDDLAERFSKFSIDKPIPQFDLRRSRRRRQIKHQPTQALIIKRKTSKNAKSNNNLDDL
ncbi:MAG: hypothetical protein EBU01_06715, partial [Crocinitomicaceae bacterium]|nr:hypothetical protein [Crocinitomicaceae bacterium]